MPALPGLGLSCLPVKTRAAPLVLAMLIGKFSRLFVLKKCFILIFLELNF
jgi:hypothetical protein